MLRTLVAFGALASAAAFAPMGARPMGLARAAPHAVSQRSLTMQVAPSSIEKEVKLDAEIFRQLDVDGSGTIEVDELKAIFGKNAAADLDGNGVLDYAEFERLTNMQKFGDAQGGNLYV